MEACQASGVARVRVGPLYMELVEPAVRQVQSARTPLDAISRFLRTSSSCAAVEQRMGRKMNKTGGGSNGTKHEGSRAKSETVEAGSSSSSISPACFNEAVRALHRLSIAMAREQARGVQTI